VLTIYGIAPDGTSFFIDHVHALGIGHKRQDLVLIIREPNKEERLVEMLPSSYAQLTINRVPCTCAVDPSTCTFHALEKP
jgi:hypothetical protein